MPNFYRISSFAAAFSKTLFGAPALIYSSKMVIAMSFAFRRCSWFSYWSAKSSKRDRSDTILTLLFALLFARLPLYPSSWTAFAAFAWPLNTFENLRTSSYFYIMWSCSDWLLARFYLPVKSSKQHFHKNSIDFWATFNNAKVLYNWVCHLFELFKLNLDFFDLFDNL